MSTRNYRKLGTEELRTMWRERGERIQANLASERRQRAASLGIPLGRVAVNPLETCPAERAGRIWLGELRYVRREKTK